MSAKRTVTIWLTGIIIIGVSYGVYHYKEDLFISNTTSIQEEKSADQTAPSPSSTTTVSDATQGPTSQGTTYSLISSISDKDVGKTVTIKGAIQDHRKSKDGTHTFLTVVDEESNSITIPIFADKQISIEFNNNEEYYFTGYVDVYNNELEVIPQEQADIIAVQKEPNVSEETVGQTKTITASVVTKYEHPDGHVFMNVTELDTKQELEIPIFKNLSYDDSNITINALIEVTGVVTVYNDRLEIIPKNATDIKVITPGDDSKVTLVTIDELTEQDRGKMYQVQGYVTNTSEHDGHLFFTFEDTEKKHRIKAVLFRADGNEINGRKIKIINASKGNFPIRILGMVDVYKDELELIIDKVYNDYNG